MKILMPCHEMAEGRIEFTLSVCVHVCWCVSVCVQNRVRPKISSCMVEFENNLAQTTIMTRRYFANKIQDARSKFKVTVCT